MRYLKYILLSILIPSLGLSAVNLDVDKNGATDINRGGTNATTAANARANLGVPATASTLVGDCTVGPCLDGTSDGGNYIKLWAGTGSYWTALQGGASTANRSWKLPIAAPPSAGNTYLMNMDEHGQMGFIDPTTYATPTGIASNMTVDASGFNGNLTTSDNTLQEIAQKLDDLVASGGTDDQTASEVNITDAGSYFTGSTVEAALQEVGLNYALKSNYLALNNTSAFTPDADYEPATKKYVDDAITAGGGYTDEMAQDAVGGMFTGNTETGIAVTYDDATAKVNFVVDFSGLSTVYQPLDTDLTTWAGVTSSANGRSLVSAADYSAMRTLLGLVPGTNVQAYDADLVTWAGITPGTGIGTWLATPSGANLASALTTALPASKGGTGLTALGTNVATSLGNAINGASGLVQLNASSQLPAVSAALLTNFPTLNQNTTGTAAALTANPTDCPAGQYATTIEANGNLTCSQVDYSQVANTPTTEELTASGLATIVSLTGNSKYWGTNASGTVGVYDLPSGGGTPTNITVADTTDTTAYVAIFESATGDLAPKTDGGLTYNAGTGMLTATGFTGPLTGTASGNTRTIASGTSTLGTSSISSGACATVVTTTATGTATTDVINWGFNSDPTSTTGYTATANGMLTIISYPSSNNVNFKVCNNTASSITPGAITLNWRVLR